MFFGVRGCLGRLVLREGWCRVMWDNGGRGFSGVGVLGRE